MYYHPNSEQPGCDRALGIKVSKHLKEHGVETPYDTTDGCPYPSWDAIRVSFQEIMSQLNLDMNDDSLRETPGRVAKMYINEVFKGLNYENFPKCTTIENKMRVNEIVICKGISVWSMCEHHLVPFTGVAHIGYIPTSKILGLSKFNRIVDFFSRRPQVQERLTEQIYRALEFILETADVAVVLNCVHNCVRLRGIRDVNSDTVTSKMGGRFLEKPEARAEFLTLCG